MWYNVSRMMKGEEEKRRGEDEKAKLDRD